MTPDNAEARRELLTAYLDGELNSSAAADVERRLNEDPAFLHEAESLKRTWELLDFLPLPQPSGDFASRTVSVVMPVIAAEKAKAAAGPHRPWARRLAFLAGAAAVALIGYALPGLFFAAPPKLTMDQREEQMARDLRVIEHLPLYQYADDIDFLQGLDSPEIFGDD